MGRTREPGRRKLLERLPGDPAQTAPAGAHSAWLAAAAVPLPSKVLAIHVGLGKRQIKYKCKSRS